LLFSFLYTNIQQKNETTKFFGGFLRKKKVFFWILHSKWE
jgi:hypothetical protein